MVHDMRWAFEKRRRNLTRMETLSSELLELVKEDSTWFGQTSHIEGALPEHVVDQTRDVTTRIQQEIQSLILHYALHTANNETEEENDE